MRLSAARRIAFLRSVSAADPIRLFLASGNAHKVAELRDLAAESGLRVSIHSAKEAGGMPPVVEDTGTFRGNAGKKAQIGRAHV